MTAKNYSKMEAEEIAGMLRNVELKPTGCDESFGFIVPDGCLLNIRGYVSSSRHLADRFLLNAADPSDESMTVFHAISPRESGNVAKLLYARTDFWQFASEGDHVAVCMRDGVRAEFVLSRRMSFDELDRMLRCTGLYIKRYAGEESDYVAVYESSNTTRRSVPVGLLNLCYPGEIFDLVLRRIISRHGSHWLSFKALVNWKKGCIKLNTRGSVGHDVLMQGAVHMFEITDSNGCRSVFKGKVVNERQSLRIRFFPGYTVPELKTFEEVQVKVWDTGGSAHELL